MQVRKALSAPRVTDVHFQTDEDNDIFGAACNLWQKLQVFSPCTKAFPGDRSRFTVTRYTRPVFWHR